MVYIRNLHSSVVRAEDFILQTIKDKLVKQYTFYWKQERDKHIHSGKLDTYFQLKQSFCMEPYLSLTNFHH